MEVLMDSGYVCSLGVCDLDKNALEKLYEWARVCFHTLCYTVHLTSFFSRNFRPLAFSPHWPSILAGSLILDDLYCLMM